MSGLTGHIRTRGACRRHRRFQLSMPRDTRQRGAWSRPGARPMGYRTVRVLLAQTESDVVCVRWRRSRRGSGAHPLYRVPSPKPSDVPLLIVRYVSFGRRILTYCSPSLPETPGGTTTHLPRVYFDIEEGLRVNTPDLVDPRPQLSIFEDGRGVTGRVQARHGRRRKCDNGEE